MLVRHSGQKVAPSVQGSSGIRAGKGSWACRRVAAPVGSLEPRHPELPGAGALQPIQPGHALPPAERSDSNTVGWLWPRKSPPARDQRTRRGGGASAPESRTLANPNEGGRACRIHAAAAGGGKGPHSGKVAGRRAFRAAPQNPGNRELACRAVPSLLFVPMSVKQAVVKRKCVGHPTARMSSSSELPAEQGETKVEPSDPRGATCLGHGQLRKIWSRLSRPDQ